MTTTRLVLVRHGESQCNVNGVVGGHAGCTGLTETGFEQARRLRDRLASTNELGSADAFYTSLLPRAIQTAEVISPTVGDGTVELVKICDLCELHPGAGDALSWQEFEERFGNPDWEVDSAIPMAPGGESWRGFVDRASKTLADIAASHPGSLVVVVCHGGIIRASFAAFFPLARKYGSLRLPTAYTSMTEWSFDGSDWGLVRYNDIAQLGGPYESMRDGSHVPRRANPRADEELPQQA
jgi:2,3-bisphosphoglycerate-dependent phosphoglycerate mutase